MTEEQDAVSARLEAVVRSVPGVVTVFAAEPALVRTARQLTTFAGAIPLVMVSAEGDVLHIAVNVGVDGNEQAPLVAASVAAAVREALVGQQVEIAVRVSRIAR